MVYGASAAAQGDTNRFYHNKLNFTFAHPPGWRVQQSSREVIATSADGSRVLTIGLARINPDEDTEVKLALWPPMATSVRWTRSSNTA